MVGAIILTADHKQEVRTITIMRNKNKASNILAPLFILNDYIISYIQNTYNISNDNNKLSSNLLININKFINNKKVSLYMYKFSFLGFYSFSDLIDNEKKHSEDIIGSLSYYVFITLFVGVLLLLINSSFSLSVKYLEKGGGFECGFTSFLQTRERYNIIFYRVSLLFLVFDLEIILAFPYPAIYQKNQNSSKNNVLAFLYILVIGFIYELKEGALNIVKTAHSTEIKVDY
jgi:NADH:ubiquinone oxidoreductase subunit 3 (subunit A)